MPFSPGMEVLPPSGPFKKAAPDRAGNPSSELTGSGFQAVLAKQGLSAGNAIAEPKGNSLPLQRQGTPDTESKSPEKAVLSDLRQQLGQLDETIEQLLQQEDEDGALSAWLTEHLGLDEAEVEAVLDSLQNWVDQPPTIAVDTEQLKNAGPDGLQQVEALTDVLEGLERQLADWLASLQNDEKPSVDIASVASMENNPAASGLATSLLDDADLPRMEQRQNRAAAMMSQILQNIQNTANSGSMPLSMDLTRSEAELVDTQLTQPGQKAVFNATMMEMARESLSGEAMRGRESSISFAPGTRLEAMNAPVGAQPSVLAETQTNILTLQRLERPMTVADFGRQLGDRIQMMVKGDVQQATIRLDPPELGALDIRVTVQNDQTQVQVVVQNPQVREALEGQSARLREFLEQQGLSLADLDVRDGSAQDGDDSAEDGPGTGQGDANGAENEDAVAQEQSGEQWRQGLVDQFV